MRFAFVLFLVVANSCAYKEKNKTQTGYEEFFRLSASELELLNHAACDESFNLDTIASYKVFDSLRNKFQKPDKLCCVLLTPDRNSSFHKPIHLLLTKPVISLGGANRNSKKKLWVYVSPDGSISGYAGGFVANVSDGKPGIYSAVRQFFLNAYAIDEKEDKNHVAYWPVGVLIELSTEDMNPVKSTLQKMVAGYIDFLHLKSQSVFEDRFENLSADQRKQLRNHYPFYVNIYTKK